MIKAYLNGKEHSSLYSEDSLTSNVFERLEYLSENKIIHKFIEKSLYKEVDTRTSITMKEFLKKKYSLSLENFHNFKIYYWPKHRTEGEPDLIVIFYNNELNDGILFLIEAKFGSGLSRNDQLISYYKSINESRYNYYNEEIKSFKGIIAPMTYLTMYNSESDIAYSKKEIGVSESIFSLKWYSLIELLDSVNNAIAKNLSDYLEYISFIEYSGLSIDFEIQPIENYQWYKE